MCVVRKEPRTLLVLQCTEGSSGLRGQPLAGTKKLLSLTELPCLLGLRASCESCFRGYVYGLLYIETVGFWAGSRARNQVR